MFYITGDTHIPYDISKLNIKNFPEQKTLTKADYVIICGDFGAVWAEGNRSDVWWLKWLEEKPFSTLFVDGNHENFDMLDAMPVERWNGGKIHRVSDGIYHLMRGQVFVIDGIRFFTMGGGASGDKEYRTEGKSWWAREMPSKEEYTEAWENLATSEYEVDYIITHTAPTSIIQQFRIRESERELNDFLEAAMEKTQYRKWYFGHVHKDVDIDDKHIKIYQRVLLLGEPDWKVVGNC